jgi:hypothetical protein
LAANALGRSAFNRVERIMAPLSRELSGVILPHDQYGNHLNNAGFLIDGDLEKKISSLLVKLWLRSGRMSQLTNFLWLLNLLFQKNRKSYLVL